MVSFFRIAAVAICINGFFLLSCTTSIAQELDSLSHPIFSGPVKEVPDKIVDQEHVRLALRFEQDTGQIYGTAKLRLRSSIDSLKSLVLHAEDIDVYSVQVGALDSLKRTVSYSDSVRGELEIALSEPQLKNIPFEVQITYIAKPNSGLYFHDPSRSHSPKATKIWTDGELENTRYWLPLYADAADLITSEIIATVPPEYSVLSNGRLLEKLETEDGKALFHYVQDQPHSPGDLGFFAGTYRIDSTSVTLDNGFTLPLTFWFPSKSPENAPESLVEIPDMLNFFSQYLDYSYPWPNYSSIIIDGMYRPDASLSGISIFNDRIIKDEKAFLEDPERFRVAQALARQWYSHLVNVDFNADIWITESVAAYLALMYIQEKEGDVAFELKLHEVASTYFEESREYRRPLVWNQWIFTDDLKDAHAMSKGIWFWHAVSSEIGPDRFQRFIRTLTRQHAFTTVNTDQLLLALNEFTGQNYTDYFDDWVYSAGHPELSVDYQYDVVSETLYVAIEQLQEGYLVSPAFAMDVDLETYSIAGAQRHSLSISREDELFSVPVAMKPRYVIVEPNYRYLAEVQVTQDASSWMTQLRYASHPISQLQAISSLQAFTDDPALLIGLQSALRSRPSPPVRAGIVNLIAALPPTAATQRILLDAFEDESMLVKKAVLKGLTAFEDISDLIILCLDVAQNSESYELQALAVQTLAEIEAPDAYSIVQSALITPSHRDVIRQSALTSLLYVNISTQERLRYAIEYSQEKHPTEVRLAAVALLTTLAEYNNKRSRAMLLDLLKDPDPSIRLASIRAFNTIGTTEDLDALTSHLEEERNKRVLRLGTQVTSKLKADNVDASLF